MAPRGAGVFGVGPSASSAQQLADGAGTSADTLHKLVYEHEWEADASLLLREGDLSVVEAYETRDRIHGYADEKAAIEAVIDAAVVGNVEGCDVLVMAPTNRLVEQINEAMTERLLDAGKLDPVDSIEIGGHRFHIGQPVVTRANDRRLTRGAENDEWVRNGDRWTVLAGTRDELYLQHRETGDRQALPAEYIAAGHLSVDYASTINRAQGATVDEAHVIIDERTNSKQMYVAMTTRPERKPRPRSAAGVRPRATRPDPHRRAMDASGSCGGSTATTSRSGECTRASPTAQRSRRRVFRAARQSANRAAVGSCRCRETTTATPVPPPRSRFGAMTSGRGVLPSCRVCRRKGQAMSIAFFVARSVIIESSGISALAADARTMATAAYSA